MLARRDVVCGMHVHVEVPRPGDRVDLMNRLMPYMPLLLGAVRLLAVLARPRHPAWPPTACRSGARCPRTGLPDLFPGRGGLRIGYVALMTRSGAIADASFLWWTLRPFGPVPDAGTPRGR